MKTLAKFNMIQGQVKPDFYKSTGYTVKNPKLIKLMNTMHHCHSYETKDKGFRLQGWIPFLELPMQLNPSIHNYEYSMNEQGELIVMILYIYVEDQITDYDKVARQLKEDGSNVQDILNKMLEVYEAGQAKFPPRESEGPSYEEIKKSWKDREKELKSMDLSNYKVGDLIR